MNCPSRPDDTWAHEDWNQNPNYLNPESTTRADLNGMANTRTQRDGTTDQDDGQPPILDGTPDDLGPRGGLSRRTGTATGSVQEEKTGLGNWKHRIPGMSKNASKIPGQEVAPSAGSGADHGSPLPPPQGVMRFLLGVTRVLRKYSKFVGPGFMVAVAYIDPGNYSTDVAAGATFRFRLLFIILMSNLFAIFLQSLCIKLGTVTGLNLAESCRAHLPKWLNLTLYVFAESAIIATDIAEVIGSAIALNLLLKIPLVAGCALTLVDVLVILLFYNPSGSMKRVRAFEMFVMLLVLGVVILFCIQLSLIENTTVGEVLRGYIPSSTIVESQGLYLSCGILGATVMPHSLYLGSGVVQTRLRDFDVKLGLQSPACEDEDDAPKYRPSLKAIQFCLRYSVAELAISLFSFALFVNSAILITAGASLSGNDEAQDADLFGIHALLSRSIAPVAGTMFALALLLSGTSAGIVCTIAGQMVSEGQLNWTVVPWLRRLITRAISITPSIIIAAAVGKDGLSAALNGTQVALSVILPFVSAPLIYFTCRNRYMTVVTNTDGMSEETKMRNHWFTAALAVVIWLIIVIMNVSLLVLVGLGKA
ncbi:MAG: hypothetical protein M1817_005843 [Caeruleum heppii]|nr:MAG: hypothetical protein M1817_005843 [Caeruleum heppii]